MVMHDAFHDLQGKSARLTAIFAYCDWCLSHPGIKGNLPDFQQSGIELIGGKPHAIVRTIGGKELATYRILTNGKLSWCDQEGY